MPTLLRSSLAVATMALCASLGACSKKQPPVSMPSGSSQAHSALDSEKVASARSDISKLASRMKVPESAITYFDANDKPIDEAAFYEGLIAKNAWKMVGKTGISTGTALPDTKTASVSVHLVNAP